MLSYFATVKMKYLTTLSTVFYFHYHQNEISDYAHYVVLLHNYYEEISGYAHYAVFLHWLHSLRCFSSLATLTTLFYSTTIKWKSLATLTKLFFLTDYAHYAVFLHLLHSLRCFTPLLLNGNLWLRCFTFTTIKMKYLTTLTTLFFFIDYTH